MKTFQLEPLTSIRAATLTFPHRSYLSVRVYNRSPSSVDTDTSEWSEEEQEGTKPSWSRPCDDRRVHTTLHNPAGMQRP